VNLKLDHAEYLQPDLDPDPDHARTRAKRFAVAALIGAVAIITGVIVYG
jgi:hypothetical protein